MPPAANAHGGGEFGLGTGRSIADTGRGGSDACVEKGARGPDDWGEGHGQPGVREHEGDEDAEGAYLVEGIGSAGGNEVAEEVVAVEGGGWGAC